MPQKPPKCICPPPSKNSPQKVYIVPEWDLSNQEPYYKGGLFTIYNLGTSELKNPTICFVLKLGQFNNHYGLTNITSTPVEGGTKYCGKLEAEKSTIKPGETQTVTFGISYSVSPSDFDLPELFTVDGQAAYPPNDTNPPSVPKNLVVSSTGMKNIVLRWDKSTDSGSGVYKYNVYYKKKNSNYTSIISVHSNSANLTNLDKNSTYSIRVSAVDFANNESAKSNEVFGKTKNQPIEIKNWDLHSAQFVDMTAWPTPNLSTNYYKFNNIKNYLLGFLVAGKSNDVVSAYWGGFLSITDANNGNTYSGDATISDYVKTDLAKLKDMEGNYSISFGGANGQLIEEVLDDIEEISEIYFGVANNYDCDHFDFDIEGGVLSNQTVVDRHIAALLKLLDKKPGLYISYTLPVDGSPGSLVGFNSSGFTLLKKLHESGIYPSMINGMAMEFSKPPQDSSGKVDLFEATKEAALGMHTHIKEIFGDYWSDDEVWNHIGLCPMFGRNNNGHSFYLEDQERLNVWASENRVVCLNGWDAKRDYDGEEVTQVPQKPGDFGKLISKYVYHPDAE